MIAQDLGIDRVERRPVLDADEIGRHFCDAVAAETGSLDDRNDVGERLTGLNLERLVRERRSIRARGELTRDVHNTSSLRRLRVVPKCLRSCFSCNGLDWNRHQLTI